MIATWLLSGGIALAGVPAHPIYLNLDNHFYLLNGSFGVSPVLKNQAGSRFIDVADSAAITNCRRAGGGSQTTTQVLMFYENSTKLLYLSQDRTRWRYQLGAAYNVFFLESANGDAICDGAVAAPVQSTGVFADGFES
jgi:hypothetical protein